MSNALSAKTDREPRILQDNALEELQLAKKESQAQVQESSHDFSDTSFSFTSRERRVVAPQEPQQTLQSEKLMRYPKLETLAQPELDNKGNEPAKKIDSSYGKNWRIHRGDGSFIGRMITMVADLLKLLEILLLKPLYLNGAKRQQRKIVRPDEDMVTERELKPKKRKRSWQFLFLR